MSGNPPSPSPFPQDEGSGADPPKLERQQLEAAGFSIQGNQFTRDDGQRYLPLYEAKMMHQFTHRWATYAPDGKTRELSADQLRNPNTVASPRYWVHEREVAARTKNRERRWLLGFRNVARSTDERTAIFTVLPRCAVAHSVPLIFNRQPVDYLTSLIANVGSFAFDYVVRQKMGGINFTFHIVKQLPIIPPHTYWTGQDRTGQDRTGQDRTGQDRTGQDRTGQDRTGQGRTGQDRTGQDRTGQDRTGQDRTGQDRTGQDRTGQDRTGQDRTGQDRTGQDRTGQDRTGQDRTGQRTSVLLDFIRPRVLEWVYTAWDLADFARDAGYAGPPFLWDDRRRFQLRCELDALFFHLYGMRRDEVEFVMDSFPIIKRKDEARHGDYRTKRAILQLYDEMASLPKLAAPAPMNARERMMAPDLSYWHG